MLGTRKPEQITCIENVLSNKPDSDFILKIITEVVLEAAVLIVANMLLFPVSVGCYKIQTGGAAEPVCLDKLIEVDVV